MQAQSSRPKKRKSLRKNTSYDAQIVKIDHPFLHSSPFYPTPKILCFTVVFNRPDTRKSAPYRGGIYIPM